MAVPSLPTISTVESGYAPDRIDANPSVSWVNFRQQSRTETETEEWADLHIVGGSTNKWKLTGVSLHHKEIDKYPDGQEFTNDWWTDWPTHLVSEELDFSDSYYLYKNSDPATFGVSENIRTVTEVKLTYKSQYVENAVTVYVSAAGVGAIIEHAILSINGENVTTKTFGGYIGDTINFNVAAATDGSPEVAQHVWKYWDGSVAGEQVHSTDTALSGSVTVQASRSFCDLVAHWGRWGTLKASVRVVPESVADMADEYGIVATVDGGSSSTARSEVDENTQHTFSLHAETGESEDYRVKFLGWYRGGTPISEDKDASDIQTVYYAGDNEITYFARFRVYKRGTGMPIYGTDGSILYDEESGSIIYDDWVPA